MPKGRTSCGNCGAAIEEPEQAEPQQQDEESEEVSETAEPSEEIEEEPVQEEVVEDEATPAEVVEAPDGTADEDLPSDEDDKEDTTPLPSNARAVKQMAEVPPDEYSFISLGDLEAGSRIEGRLMEVDGDLFDYFIVDVEGYEAMSEGEEAESLDESFDSTKYQIELDIGEGGKYYLVLENRSESEPVNVKVDLRVFSP